MANNVFNQLRKRFDNKESVPNKGEAVMRALELLRINIQGAFDKEIDVIVKKFTELYFDTAFKNIKENLGDHGISEDVLQRMTCALLENSKIQYNAKIKSSALKCPRQEIGVGEKRQHSDPTEAVPIKRELIIKREALSPDSAPHSEVNKLVSGKRQIFWNTSCINIETRFILDIQANQAFGFGNDGKERLASKHPELIRYLPDGSDRDWLVDQKVIPSQHKNFRFLFLLYDEVMKLALSEKYTQRDNLNLSVLHYFRIPKFMVDKMHNFFVDLNVKSKGLISNTTDKKPNENEDRNSHLRNALLQGTSTQMLLLNKEQPIIDKAQQQLHIFTTNAGTSSTTIFQQSNGTIFQVKPKPSLSLSHATLTALLRSNKVINTNPSE